MKFRYDFVNGHETIEVDEEWMAVLREFDRLEYNAEKRQRYHCWHYDAYTYEGSEMGKEDSDLAELLDGTPAFEYAIEHLIPKYREILYRRAYNGEKYKDIAKDYGVTDTCIFHIYKRASERFQKYYEEGSWLYSRDNKDSIAVPKVAKIPFGLTPAQVMAIRAYRQDYKSMTDIANILGIPRNRVKCCLHDNPILETKCPYCKTVISQPIYGKMRVFCSPACHTKWFRINGANEATTISSVMKGTKLIEEEKQVIDFYRFHFLSIEHISKLLGISEQRISAHFYSNPIPYTLCKNCGCKVPGAIGQRTTLYCSKKCRDIYNQKMKKARKKMKGKGPETVTPMPEQLFYAIALRKLGYTIADISCFCGLSDIKIDDLFRFHKPSFICKVCKKPFAPKTTLQRCCSAECKEKAKAYKERSAKAVFAKTKKRNEVSKNG